MIHTETNEDIIYKVDRMLNYEMENLHIDVYAKAELLVMFKYVLHNVGHFRAVFGDEIDEEYQETCKRFIKRR